MNRAKILWVDDEVEFLQPHILFLREKDTTWTPPPTRKTGWI